MSKIQPGQLEIVLFFDIEEFFAIKSDPIRHFTSEQIKLAHKKAKELREIIGI